jgi:hypothetical protein
MTPNDTVTRVLSRGERRAPMATGLADHQPQSSGRDLTGCEIHPLPVRHQGEVGTSPGQREQNSWLRADMTSRCGLCAISVTKPPFSSQFGQSRTGKLESTSPSAADRNDDHHVFTALYRG